jgi:hypothetical protein
VVKAGKEVGEDIKEKAEDIVDGAKDQLSDAGDIAKQKAEEAYEIAKEKADEYGKIAKEKASEAYEKASDFAEDVSEKVFGSKETKSADDIMDEIMNKTETEDEPSNLKEEYIPKNPITGKKADVGTQPLAGTIGEEMMKSGENIMNTLKKTAKDVGEAIDKNPVVNAAKDVAENVGDKVLDAGEQFMEKFGETAEKVGGVVLDKGGDALEKAGGIAEDLGSKILKAKDDLMAKAQEEAAKSGDTMENIMDKAKAMADKIEDKVSGKTDFDKEFSKERPDLSSEMDKHDSFWDKAEKFAEGDYHGTGKKGEPEKKEGEITIQKDPDYKPKQIEGTLKGFEDGDGDGDELIDDAIVED